MDVVAAVLSQLRKSLGQDRFDLWIGNAEGWSFTGGRLEVIAASSFALDRLRQQLGGEIRQACREVLGEMPAITFSIGAPRKDAQPPGDLPAAGAGEPKPTGFKVVRSSGQREEALPAASRRSRGQISKATSGRSYLQLGQFAVGDGNRLAHASACDVVKRPGSVSPVVLFGPTGTGKTHLLEGIVAGLRGGRTRRRVVNLSAEQFTTLFLEALRGSGLPSFRRKYRDVDVLLIDDIQFFAGKKATLVELHHTVDHLSRDGRQIVLAADRHPLQLKELGEDLLPRLSGGLVISLAPADEPTRREIIRRIAQRREFELPEDVLGLLATRLPGDARQISGALNRLQAASRAFGRKVDADFVEDTLFDFFDAAAAQVRLDDVEKAICEVFEIEPDSLKSRRRNKDVSQPRMLAMWLARKYTRAALSEIGEHFGHRSHSTVVSAEKRVSTWLGGRKPLRFGSREIKADQAVQLLKSTLKIG